MDRFRERASHVPRFAWRILIALSALVLFAGASAAEIPPLDVLPEFPPVGTDPDPGEAIGSLCIDFDELEDGTVVTDQFPEATFDSIPGQENVTLTVPPITRGPFICTRTIGEDLNCANPTFVDFTDPVVELTLMGIGINGVGPVATINVFEDGVPAGSITVIGLGDQFTPVPIDLTGFSNVTRIELTEITDAAGIGWDDFCFDEAAEVPAASGPGLTFLVALILAASALLRKRRYSGGAMQVGPA